MSTLNARLILTDHSPLPVPERPCEGVSRSVGCDALFGCLEYSCWWRSSCSGDVQVFKLKRKMWCWHLICWEEKTLLGEKVLSTCSSYCVCTNAQFIWIWSSCACAWVKRNKGCLMHVLMSGNTLYAYKKMCNINNMLCEKEFWWVLQREIVAYQTLESVHRLSTL